MFWLNSGIDRGDIERQETVWIDPVLFGKPVKEAEIILWRDHLQPLGLKLMEEALRDVQAGRINRTPQDEKYSTFEPALNPPMIPRPDLLMLGTGAD